MSSFRIFSSILAGGAVFCTAVISAGCGARQSDTNAATTVPAEQRLPDGTLLIPAGSPKLSEIHTASIRKAEMPFDEVVSPGKIETNPNLVSRVTLPVPGRVTAVLVKLGDSVKRGQPLIEMESPDVDAAQSTYMQSQATVTQAQANLNKAQADYDRSSDLFSHNAVAQKDVLTAENALTQAKTALDQAQEALEQASRRLQILGMRPGAFGQKLTIPAPVSGKVLEMTVAPGEYHNDTNAPVMTIADLSTVWVSSDVPESAIRFIRTGERIDVTLTAYPGEIFRGRVTRISDTVDPQTHTIKVRAEMNNDGERLRPEMFGAIRHTDSMRLVPAAPETAVTQEAGKTIIWVERAQGRFQPVEVATGDRSGGLVPVLRGINEGDRVVVDGAMLLKTQ